MLDKIGVALLDKLSKTRSWEWFVKKYLSSYTLRWFGYPKFPMEDFFKIVDTLDKEKVYCFVCSDYESLGSKVIRSITDSKFTHAGFIIPDGDRNTRCVHMRSSGLQVDHLLSLLREVDYIAIVDPAVSSYKEAKIRIKDVLANPKEYSYDFEEKLDNNPYKMYCSELIYKVLMGICWSPKFKPQVILGREVFLPDNIVDIGEVVYTNHAGLQLKVLNSCEANQAGLS